MQSTQQRPPEINDPEQNKATIKHAFLVAGAIIAFVLILVLSLSWYQAYATPTGSTQATPTPEATPPPQGGSGGSGGTDATATVTPATGGAAPAATAAPTRAATPASAAPIIPTTIVTTPPATPASPPQPTARATSPGVQTTPTVP